jgi:hypothetical protein
MTIREAAARLVVERLRLGGAFFTYKTILSLAMREAQVLGLSERDMETAVCEKFCSQTDLGRTALEMWRDSRNHEEIRGCGIEVQGLLCREAEQYEDLLPGGALHTKCARIIAAANAAARQDIRSILRGD